MNCNWDYELLKGTITGEQLPAMVVDLDCLDTNISNISALVAGFGKKIRIASKSIRVPWLLKYIIKNGGTHFQGLMCFSVSEAEFLYSQGFDDLLLAYPTVSVSDINTFCSLTQKGANISLMIDCAEHLQLIEKVWEAAEENHISGKVCIDVDMSWKPAGLHIGAQRSPVRSLTDFKKLYGQIAKSKYTIFAGVMGYEAQIAGMGDKNPFSTLLNPAKRFIKRKSVSDILLRREEIHAFLQAEKKTPEIFNGGGTGSLITTGKEPWLTEVTAGSGFLQSHLFDYFANNRNMPAFCFGLEVCRKPQNGVVTCKSGGFIASGDISPDKWPQAFLPQGIKTLKNEGFGEVQTPLKIPAGLNIDLGDPLFFRPAKAGEIAEHFSEYILIRNNEIVAKIPTYRGLGKYFY